MVLKKVVLMVPLKDCESAVWRVDLREYLLVDKRAGFLVVT